MNRAALVAATAVICLLAAASAQASSIVFTKDDGNVWLARPDGSGLYRVTLNGTPSNPYTSASQANDGTIVASRGDGSGDDVLIRMRQNGQVLRSFRPPVYPNYPTSSVDEVAVSPDGTRIAYRVSYLGNSSCTAPGANVECHWVAVASATGASLGSETFVEAPAWMSNSRLVVDTRGGSMATYDVGADDAVDWFNGPEDQNGLADRLDAGDVTRAGGKLATTAWNADFDAEPGYQSSNVLYSWTANGAPPAAPSIRCQLGPVKAFFLHPSWSPDGSGLAFEIDTESTPTGLEGIWVYHGDWSSCSSLAGKRIVVGAHDPDWGPANVNPPPRDTTPPQTTIVSGPAAGSVSHDATPTFGFRSSEAGSTFRCRVDGGAFARCTTPKTTGRLANGRHTFAVRATDKAGNTDRTAASRAWTVKR